jgi:hypothetical protein
VEKALGPWRRRTARECGFTAEVSLLNPTRGHHLILILLLACGNAAAQSCKSDPKLVSPCYTVHGKMYNANGGSIARIWKVGTKRVLGVTRDLPSSVQAYRGDFDDILYGDFLVCPYTREKPGVMQLVCVESARNMVKRKRLP